MSADWQNWIKRFFHHQSSPCTLLFTSSPGWEFMEFMDAVPNVHPPKFSPKFLVFHRVLTLPIPCGLLHCPSEVHGVVTPQPSDHPRSTGAHGIWTLELEAFGRLQHVSPRGQSIHNAFCCMEHLGLESGI
jgi:hypothetical protein